LAALAVRVCRLFAGRPAGTHGDESTNPEAAMAQAILAALSEPETPSKLAILD
jgi:hypothetical protein